MNIEEMAEAHNEYEEEERRLERDRTWKKKYGGHERL